MIPCNQAAEHSTDKTILMFFKSHRVLLRKLIVLYKHPFLKSFRIYRLNYFSAAA